ncbi:unnamed protein product [Closterium sp. NIES-54]
MGLVLGGRGPVVLTGHADASWVDDSATQRSSQGYTFSLGSDSVSWRSTRSSSVLSSSCEAEIYAGAMAAQKLRWLTYLLTDLGEQPRSPPVLYVDNKAMIALCQEHRLEHRTKHIALRYFLARELQQRGQLRLAPLSESDILPSLRIGHDGVLPRLVPFAFFLGFIHFFVRQQRLRLYLCWICQLLESPLQPPDLNIELFPSCPQRVPQPAVTVLLLVPAFPALLTCRHIGAFTLQVPVLSTGVTKPRVGSPAAPRCGIGYRHRNPARLRPALSFQIFQIQQSLRLFRFLRQRIDFLESDISADVVDGAPHHSFELFV